MKLLKTWLEKKVSMWDALTKDLFLKLMCIKYDALTMNGCELHHNQARLKGDLSEFLITCQRYNRKK